MTSKHDGTDETTPLIRKESVPSGTSWIKPVHLVLVCGFLVSASFGVTQVPLLYAFRDMTCEAYYQTHPASPAGCSLPVIEASTARAVALLGFSTTFFGIANLFITGWSIKRIGVKASLIIQVFWPAARLLVQNIGVMTGGKRGIVIVQCSQIITIVGGPNGYLLALNTFVTEVTEHKERTGYLGRLQGCFMMGSAAGLLLGGVLAEAFALITPFQVTLGLFLASTAYSLLVLPYVPPKQQKKESSGIARMLGPLSTILPKKWILRDGQVKTEYGAIILVAGVFMGVLATGYIPTLLVMYAQGVFDFGARRSSYMTSMHSFLRGAFLVLVFPRLIKLGRRIIENKQSAVSTSTSGSATPSERTQLANAMQDDEEQDVMPPKPSDEQETFEFDLIYTRMSLLVDGVLTLGAAFVSEGWQMYLIAALLPLGAGTASAAKGTILQMSPQNERTDALSAIAFVEMIARLSTTFVFGLIFAAFASMNKTYLVFVCNAGVALFGFCVLLLSRFPPPGSKRLKTKVDEVEETAAQ